MAAFQGVSYSALIEIGVNFAGRNVGPMPQVPELPLWGLMRSQALCRNPIGTIWEPISPGAGGDFANPNFNNLTSGPLFTNDGLSGTRGVTPITLTLTSNDAWNSDGAVGQPRTSD